MNLELFEEWKDTDAVKYAIYFLDAVMSEFIEKTKDNYYLSTAHNFAKRHRAVGLGVMGWHSFLQRNMIAFESLEAKTWTNVIFKHIKTQALEASKYLGEIFGAAPIFEELPTIDWYRNSTVMAVAPTTSSSAILGQVSPGIEPFSSNYYKAGLAKGNFIRKNKYLKNVLAEYDLDTDDVWREIMLRSGSVQHITELPKEYRDVFKTFRELSQMEIIIQASIRQKYIDQSQSLNINIPAEVPIREVNQLIIEAWKLGIKTLYYQRSSSISKDLLTNIVSCSSCES